MRDSPTLEPMLCLFIAIGKKFNKPSGEPLTGSDMCTACASLPSTFSPSSACVAMMSSMKHEQLVKPQRGHDLPSLDGGNFSGTLVTSIARNLPFQKLLTLSTGSRKIRLKRAIRPASRMSVGRAAAMPGLSLKSALVNNGLADRSASDNDSRCGCVGRLCLWIPITVHRQREKLLFVMSGFWNA